MDRTWADSKEEIPHPDSAKVEKARRSFGPGIKENFRN